MIKLQTRVRFLIAFVLLAAVSSCPDDPYCLMCDITPSVSQCIVCDRSFFNIRTFKCETGIKDADPNCLTYSEEDSGVQCEECAFGFRLTSDHKCVPCKKENCAVCDENDHCWACKGGVIPHETTSECSTQNKCAVENCQICQGFQDKWGCDLCDEGFALSDFSVRTCIASRVGCQLVDQQKPDKCLQCLSGYFIDQDQICQKRTTSVLPYFLYFGGLLLIVILGIVLFRLLKRDRDNDVYLLSVNGE